MSNPNQVYEWLTNHIVEKMETGVVPWRKPWKTNTVYPTSYKGHQYRGFNFFLFQLISHSVPVYLSPKDVKDKGGKMTAGKNLPVFYWSTFDRKDKDENGKAKKGFVFRYYNVWNIEDVTLADGSPFPLPAWYKKRVIELETREVNPIASAEAIMHGYEDAPELIYGGPQACYLPVSDKMKMPDAKYFVADDAFYATLFHETIHSTGHSSRLNREEVMNTDGYGNHKYSKEELVAELGSAFLCAEAGISNEALEDNAAAYLKTWMRALKDDPKLFAQAASRAQKAADYVLGRTYEKGEEQSEAA